MKTVEPTAERLQTRAKSTPLDRFCRSIRKDCKSLHHVSTERLARLYRSYFALPHVINQDILEKHCALIKVDRLIIGALPDEISAYNQEYRGKRIIAVNINQWPGIHILSVFHELYEILDRRYSQLFNDYKPLRGQAREDRANKFAVCILIHRPDFITCADLFMAAPELELQLGKKIITTVLVRMRNLALGKHPSLYIHYGKINNINSEGTLLAKDVWFNRGRDFLPLKSRRILKSLLPKKFEPYNSKWLPLECLKYQGPIFVKHETGFDLFKYHDLSIICLPVFSEGEISNIFILGVKTIDVNVMLQLVNSYKPKHIEEAFQRI